MLAALAAVSLPWIIEWLFRRRRRVVELPTIRFLLNNPEQRKVRLQDLIVLLVRSLVIFLFVAALARPILRPDPLLASGRKHLDVLLVFDATYSNAQKVGSDSAFALARRIGSEVTAALPKGSRVTVATLGDRVAVVMEDTEDLPAVRERIEQLEVSDKAGFIGDALAWAEAFVAARRVAPAEIYILSDMQEATWGRRPTGAAGDPRAGLQRLFEKNRVFLADTGGGPTANYCLTRFEPTESVIVAGIPASFAVTAEATNLGTRSAANASPGTHRAELTLYVDGERQNTQSFALGAQPHTAMFQHTFLHGGTYLLKAALQGDSHTMDNVRYCLLTVPENHRVLVVDDRGDRPLLETDTGLLELAISPPQKPGRDKVSAFLATVTTPEGFSRQNLASYEVVVLANLSQVPSQLVGALEVFVAEGGSLIVLLGDRVVPFEHNRKLHKDGRGLLPCALGDGAAAEGKELSLLFDGGTGFQPMGHGQDARATGLPQGGMRKYLPLSLDTGDKGCRVLARFSDGAPALVERAFGRGRVLLFAGAAKPGWGDLPLSERFPILIQGILRDLLGDPNREVNLEVGGVFDQPVLMTSQHLTLKRPDGRKARLTPVRAEGQAVRRVRYADTDRAGVYEVDTIPEVLARRRFVVNLAPTESDLRRLDAARFALAFGQPEAAFLPAPSRVRRFVEELHSVREAAGGLLWGLFALLAGETYLAFRFGRRRA